MASRGRSGRRNERGSRPRRARTERPVGLTPETSAMLTWASVGLLTPTSQQGAVYVGVALDDALRRFREQFGRDPLPDDPVMWDPGADTPHSFR